MVKRANLKRHKVVLVDQNKENNKEKEDDDGES